jgi:hypothetical protein
VDTAALCSICAQRGRTEYWMLRSANWSSVFSYWCGIRASWIEEVGQLKSKKISTRSKVARLRRLALRTLISKKTKVTAVCTT